MGFLFKFKCTKRVHCFQVIIQIFFFICYAICIYNLTIICILSGKILLRHKVAEWQQCPILNRLVSRKTGTLAILNWGCFSKWTEKSFHYTCHRRVVIVLPRLFVQFLFYLQDVHLPLCCCVKTRCMVEAFIQVHVVIGYFIMTCLTACCHSVTSSAVQLLQGWKGPFLSVQGCSHPSLSLCQIVYGCISTCGFKIVWVTRLECACGHFGPFLNSLAVSDLAMTCSLVSKWLAEHACCTYSLSPDTTQLALFVCALAQQSETEQLTGDPQTCSAYFGAKHTWGMDFMQVCIYRLLYSQKNTNTQNWNCF